MRLSLILTSLLLLLIIFTSPAKAQYDGGYTGDSGGDNGGNSSSGNDDSGYDNGGGGSAPESDGSYGSSCGGPKTLSGYVYDDRNQSGSYNDGDKPLPGQRITLHGQTQWTAGECDENGQNCAPPTGTPGPLIGDVTTDGTGHYSIGNINTGTYEVRHYNTTGAPRVNPTEDVQTVNIACNRYRSWGVYKNSPEFYQNPPLSICFGPEPHIGVSWNQSSSAATNYIIHYTNQAGNQTGTIPINSTNQADLYYNFNSTSSVQLTPGQTYSFIIEARNASTPLAYSDNGAWSHTMWSYSEYPNCNAPDRPQITLTLTHAGSSQQSGGLPFKINQNAGPLSLNWNVTNAASCTASSSPSQVWTGLKAPSSGTDIVTAITQTVGSHLFTLTCYSNAGKTNQTTIQADVKPYPPAYFKTTGGDVHSNERIMLTP